MNKKKTLCHSLLLMEPQSEQMDFTLLITNDIPSCVSDKSTGFLERARIIFPSKLNTCFIEPMVGIMHIQMCCLYEAGCVLKGLAYCCSSPALLRDLGLNL